MNGLTLQNRKVLIGGSALLAVLIVVIAWLVAIGPERSSADSLRAQAADTVVQNSQLAAQGAALVKQAKNLPALRSKLTRALDGLPPQPDLSDFTKALTATAHRAGVNLTSITVGTVQTPATVAAPVPTTTATSTDSAAPIAVATSAAPTQLTAPITVQVSGPGPKILAFLESVRRGARSATVTSAQMTRTGADAFVATAQLEVFSAPMSAGQRAGLQHLLRTGN